MNGIAALMQKGERYKYMDFAFLGAENYLPAVHQPELCVKNEMALLSLPNTACIRLVLVNGFYEPRFSDISALPKDVIVMSLRQAMTQHADLMLHDEIDAAKYPFANLNTTAFQDGVFLYVPDQCEIELPIHILALGKGEKPFFTQARNMIIMGANSKLVLFNEYISEISARYVANDVDVIRLGKGARLELNKYQHENNRAHRFTHTFISQHQDSNTLYGCFSLGGQLHRDDVVVDLLQTGAECRTGGFYRLTSDGQYVDNHVDINHRAPHSHSEMLYKGVLDKKTRAVFNGRLHVLKDAQKINAYQANHSILLANGAEVYSKPELEIYADDVKCKHGATMGQIDQDALFYMRARGITKTEAMSILLQGFADEVLQRISTPAIRAQVKEAVST